MYLTCVCIIYLYLISLKITVWIIGINSELWKLEQYLFFNFSRNCLDCILRWLWILDWRTWGWCNGEHFLLGIENRIIIWFVFYIKLISDIRAQICRYNFVSSWFCNRFFWWVEVTMYQTCVWVVSFHTVFFDVTIKIICTNNELLI